MPAIFRWNIIPGMLNKQKSLHSWLCAALALLVSILACDLPTTEMLTPTVSASASQTPFLPSAAPATNTPEILPSPTTQAYQPVFKSAPCAFAVPAGYSPECGYLVVPENRYVQNSPSIQLHVAIFRSIAEGPDPDP